MIKEKRFLLRMEVINMQNMSMKPKEKKLIKRGRFLSEVK